MGAVTWIRNVFVLSVRATGSASDSLAIAASYRLLADQTRIARKPLPTGLAVRML
jgi:hypothetical protein